MARQQKIGKFGEETAQDYLQKRGYHILAINWRCPAGELDIVARDDQEIVFVEVKTRRTSAEQAFVSITPTKQARMTSAIYAYLEAHQLEQERWRVDIIAVVLQPLTIHHVEDAFDW